MPVLGHRWEVAGNVLNSCNGVKDEELGAAFSHQCSVVTWASRIFIVYQRLQKERTKSQNKWLNIMRASE